jgi:hypothetical protein
MTQLIPIDQARALAPTKMTQRIAEGRALNTNFADGVQNAFPVLSIRGKVFRIRDEGKEEAYVDPASKMPLPFLDVVLVNGSRTLAKSYYETGFDEDNMTQQPDCWSLDSIRPHPTVPNKVHPTCPDCPKNAFGSRITPAGKAAKACSDARRICVTLPHYLANPEPRIMMLRVPQTSLKNLKGYVELLAKNGYEPTGCVTRLSFDYNEAFPKLQFNFVGPVTNEEFEVIEAQASSPTVTSMLQMPDFDTAKSDQRANAQAATPLVRQAPPVTEGAFGGAPTEPQTGKVETKPAERQAPPQASAFAGPEDEGEEEQQVYTSTEGLIETPDGWITPDGELVTVQLPEEQAAAPTQEIDPDVIPMKNGKFFNKKTGAFVESQYRDVVPAPVKGKAKAAAAPAAKPAKGKSTKGGNGTEAKPQVVAASPKLEQLLGELVPPKK